MATAYLDPAGVARVVGNAALAAAAPDPSDRCAYAAAAVQEAIDAVAEQVDARLANAYDVPLTDVPEFLARAIARIVHDELTGPATDTEQIQRRAEAAWKMVDRIARGELRIGAADIDADGAANPRTRQGRAVRVGLDPGAFDLRGLV